MATLIVLGLAVAGLVESHRRGRQAGNWLFKPVASSCLVALALGGALDEPYTRGVLAALGAFWVSDLFLIPHTRRWAFVAGMVAAFAGHFLYLSAFATRPDGLRGAMLHRRCIDQHPPDGATGGRRSEATNDPPRRRQGEQAAKRQGARGRSDRPARPTGGPHL